MRMRVSYLSGAGNAFTVVQSRERRYPPEFWRALAPQLCPWTDGLLVIGAVQPGQPVSVLYFNPDGSTGMFCGNGARCAAAVVLRQQGVVPPVRLVLAGQEVEATPSERGIRLRMAPPARLPEERMVELPDQRLHLWSVDVGAPHALIALEDIGQPATLQQLERFALEPLARQVRYAKEFAPAGVNVSLYVRTQESSFAIRTYERGVEEETGSCGTAAIALALVAMQRYRVRPPVEVLPTSRSLLVVDWEGEFPHLQALYLEGEVEWVGEDTLEVTLEDLG
jgi:diaminopimelate epimerase